METVIYFTLAEAYKANESAYDAALKAAVYAAAADVGDEILIAALSSGFFDVEHKKAA